MLSSTMHTNISKKRFGVSAIGSITVSPEVMPGAERVREIAGKGQRTRRDLRVLRTTVPAKIGGDSYREALTQALVC